MRGTVPLVLFAAVALAQSNRPVDEFATSAGPVRITMINHATMMVEGGGQVIAEGPPEHVAQCDGSETGRYLGAALAQRAAN